MVKTSISIGDKKVVASGVVVMPISESVLFINIDDLVFKYEFLSSSSGKMSIETEVVGMELSFKFYNYDSLVGQGLTSSWVPVATLLGRPLGMSFMCYTNTNKSRVVEYTFAYTDSESSVVGDSNE